MENMRDNPVEEEAIDLLVLLEDFWRGFKKLWWLFPITIGLGILVLCQVTKQSYRPSYTAYASFVVNIKDSQGYAQTYYNQTAAEQLSKTFPYILTSGALKEVIEEDLGEDTLPVTITAEAVEETALFSIRVSSSDPELSYQALQSAIENYPRVAEYIIGSTKLTLMDESGVPQKPDQELNYRRAVKLGGLGGFGLGCLVLLVYALGRRTVRREEDIKKRMSIVNLGIVPHVPRKKRSRKEEKAILLDQREDERYIGEVFRGIRTRVVKELKDKKKKIILVTSTAKGEGKTTSGVNLALALEKKGGQVVLIDADLRNPSVLKTLKMVPGEREIQDVLKGNAGMTEALKRYGESGLWVLGGEKVAKDTLKLLDGRYMDQLLEEASGFADYVIVDTPPCGVMADAQILARKAGGVVLVIRQDWVRIERILYGIEGLTETGAPILGYILNGVKAGITGYGYGYGYSYGYGYRRGYGYGRKRPYGEEKTGEAVPQSGAEPEDTDGKDREE